jgi:molybdopterin converting factor small subunit
MGRIAVRYRGNLAEAIGIREESIEAATVAEVLRHVKARTDRATYRNAKAMLIAVNGVSILKKRGFGTALSGGDVVSFLPLASGG